MKTLAVALIPVALGLLTLYVLRFHIRGDAEGIRRTERVLYHVGGVLCLLLTGGLAIAAYNVREGALAIALVAIAIAFGINAVRYLNGQRGR